MFLNELFMEIINDHDFPFYHINNCEVESFKGNFFLEKLSH